MNLIQKLAYNPITKAIQAILPGGVSLRLPDYEEGTFNALLGGCTTTPTVTAKYVRSGKNVTITIPANTATSNTTACTIQNMPTQIAPLSQVSFYGRSINSSVSAIANFEIATSGLITFYSSISSSAFTASGLKGHGDLSFSYTLT